MSNPIEESAQLLAEHPQLKDGVWVFETLPGFGHLLTQAAVKWLQLMGGTGRMIPVPEIVDGELRRLHVVCFPQE
jgi:hypothetical protein